jgi:hypothetical protein
MASGLHLRCWEFPMTVALRADLFPTTLTITSNDDLSAVLDRARIIITAGDPDWIFVYRDAVNGPELVFSEIALSYDPPPIPRSKREALAPMFTIHRVETPTSSILFLKNGGCGCGSRLKSFNPLPTIRALGAL